MDLQLKPVTEKNFIKENEPAIRVYEKVGFEPTGEVFQAFHPEPVYRLTV
ncbi:GNAT family protein [Cytobacillus firmus]|nr:GNAT family protein [Cytobacillus firmus]